MRFFGGFTTILALTLLSACGDEKGGATSTGGPAQKVITSNTPSPDAAKTVETSTGGSTDEPTPVAKPLSLSIAPVAPNAPMWDPKQDGSACVKVKALFEGDALPKRKKIDMGKDEKCVAANAKPLTEDELVNKENKGIANVFVFVKKGHEGKKSAEKAAEINQVGCVYVPHVLGVMPGQKIKVKNSDDTTHNIHGLPTKSKEFNFTQNKKDQVDEAAIDNEEYPVKVKCDIHPWMGAWVFVLPHSYHATTDTNGDGAINLPPGEYEIMAWHEVYGEGAAQTVKVADKEEKALTFKFTRK
jgi:plastocyanin